MTAAYYNKNNLGGGKGATVTSRTTAVWRYSFTNSKWENDTPLTKPMTKHRTFYFNHQIVHHYAMGRNQRYLNIMDI